jgi:hypothetical protein
VPGGLGSDRLPLGAIHQPYCTSLAMHVTAGGTCAIIHMTGEEDCSCSSWQVTSLVLNDRSHCLTYVHFANFNCPSRARYTAGQFACHVHNGGSYDLPCLLGQFTLLYMSNCMLCALLQVTLPVVGTMSCYTACLVHYGRGSMPAMCTLAVPIACHIHCGRSDRLTCALWRFPLPVTCKRQVRDCLPRELVHVTLLAICNGRTHSSYCSNIASCAQ